MRRILILGGILLLAIPSLGYAQSQRLVRGYVMDENNRPLPEAAVSVDGKTFVRVSEDGSFSINVSYMIPSITAYCDDYLPSEKKIDGSYMIFKLAVDAEAEKDRMAAEEKARKDAEAKAKADEAARVKAEKDRLAAEEKARKDAEAKAKADEAARVKAEKDRLAAEEKARKDAEAKAKADEAARVKAEKDRLAAVEKARKDAEAKAIADEAARAKAEKKAVRQQKDADYDARFRNKGLEHTVDVSYSYPLYKFDLMYTYSGYREYGTLHPFELDYTLSYRINRYVSVGAGAGVLFHAKSFTIVNDSFSSVYGEFKERRLDVPVFATVRLTPCRSAVRPVIGGSAGYYILSKTLLWEGDLGVEFRMSRRASAHLLLSARSTPYPYFREISETAGEAGYFPAISPAVKIGFSF